LGYLCTPDGRQPDDDKIKKVLEWKSCRDLRDVRAFLGLVGFYRIWVFRFAIIAIPLYALTKKDVAWKWEAEEQKAMDELRAVITSAPILATLVYDDPRYGYVYLMTDASLEGWGGVIEQLGPDTKRHPCRFESGIWNPAEKGYDATKRELRGLLNLLKRFKRYLYGVHFVIETDALVLVHQLNGAASDLPGSLMMRWITWIRFFDFTIKHIPGSKNPVADALSRKPPGPSDQREKEDEQDIDDWIDAQIFVQSRPPKPRTVPEPAKVLSDGYSEHSQRIAEYLVTMAEPPHLRNNWKRKQFKVEALKFFVRRRHLFLRPHLETSTPRRVVDSPDDQRRIFQKSHDECGHRGRESTYSRVTTHYYWKGMYTDVVNWIRACAPCQQWDAKRFQQAAGWTHPSPVPFAKWHLDIQYMPSSNKGKKCFLLEARDDLTGFVEAAILPDKSSLSVQRFIKQTLLLRWGFPLAVVVDGGSEFKGEAQQILKDLNIQRISISPYNSQANGINEAGHIPIASSLAKMTQGTGKNWRELLPYVLHADRTALRGVLGRSPFSLVHNYEPMGLVEFDVPTWRTINWEDVNPVRPDGTKDIEVHQKLLVLRAKALWEADHDLEIAAERVAKARKAAAERRNDAHAHRFRPERGEIEVKDLVLIYNNVRKIDMSSFRKLEFRWEGPFRVRRIADDGNYFLETLDGIPIRSPFSPPRVKKFFQLDGVWVETTEPINAASNPEPQRQGEESERTAQREELHEEPVPEEAVGRADVDYQDKQSAAAGKLKTRVVVEIPRGKPKGW
jgi:transposase InsO family protein